jgi:hypothetical protein
MTVLLTSKRLTNFFIVFSRRETKCANALKVIILQWVCLSLLNLSGSALLLKLVCWLLAPEGGLKIGQPAKAVAL